MNSGISGIQDARLIIFTRFPVPGQTKTRLIPLLGPEGAADLQKRMTEYTVKEASRIGCALQIRYTGGTASQMRDWLGDEYDYAPQGEGTLGERMARAVAEVFEEGIQKVLLVGCDCPDNRCENMLRAINMLDRVACVIGPAADGGYYLIGLREPRWDLFRHIEWGTERVFRQTVAKCDAYRLLPVLNDVDEPQDVPRRISVIIPTLNEEESVHDTVRSVLQGFDTEAIVVDGGSLDATGDCAQRAGAIVYRGPSGRALQMNLGASQASGDILLFLHADTELPPGWDRHVRETMRWPGTTLGHFRFSIKDPFSGRRWIEFGANLRARILKQPYGDQGLFLWRKDFVEWGGFPEIPILEDLYLVRMARKRGPIRCTNVNLPTSGRRWVKFGAVRTTLLNQAIRIAHWVGADLSQLRDAYRQGKNPLRAISWKRIGK